MNSSKPSFSRSGPGRSCGPNIRARIKASRTHGDHLGIDGRPVVLVSEDWSCGARFLGAPARFGVRRGPALGGGGGGGGVDSLMGHILRAFIKPRWVGLGFSVDLRPRFGHSQWRIANAGLRYPPKRSIFLVHFADAFVYSEWLSGKSSHFSGVSICHVCDLD